MGSSEYEGVQSFLDDLSYDSTQDVTSSVGPSHFGVAFVVFALSTVAVVVVSANWKRFGMEKKFSASTVVGDDKDVNTSLIYGSINPEPAQTVAFQQA